MSRTGLRIVLFTVDDLEFVPDLLEPVIAEWGGSIVKAYVSRSLFDFKDLKKRLPTLLKSGYPFCIRPGDLLRFVRMKLWGGQSRKRGASNMLSWLRAKQLDADYVGDIHCASMLAELEALQADVFLFGAFDKIAKTPVLSIPRLGTFNVHMGKLPEHRGGLSAFWVLRFGDKEAGMTVHRAVEKLDAGEIVAETRFPVTTNSMDELMRQTFRAGAHTINTALDRLAEGGWTPVSTEGRPSAYYRIPTGEDFREFYKRGCRLI
jgi:folate-dependent phosphoribosylglycinamide formyltransferase PurN